MNEVYSEESIIGTLITSDGELMQELPAQLDASMFTDEVFANAFGIFQAAYEKSEKVSLAILKQRIIARSGGMPPEYISKRIDDAVRKGYSSLTAQEDANEIITAYKARRLSEVLNKTVVTPDNLSAAVDYLSMEIENLNQKSGQRTKSLPQIVRENKGNYFRESDTPKIELEFVTLNDMVGGFEAGDMIVIGARPAVGKSAFAAQLTSHFAEIGKKIAYFNLEMTEKQIYERFVSSASGIGIQRVRRALNFTGDEQERCDKANAILEQKDKIIVTTGSQTVASIRNEVKKHDYDLVVIDYLQLIKAEGRYKGNRFAEVGEISHSLKALATDFNIPVIVLSQLNRASVGREDKEPSMSELRESGDIEQDASIIILLWNLDQDEKEKGCKVEKNRQGKIGKVTLRFNGDLMRFEEISDADGFIKMDDTPFSV